MVAFRKIITSGACGLAILGTAQVTHAAETNVEAGAKTPVTITFNGVRAGDVPFYVSIQTQDDYQSMKGHGGIMKTTESGSFTRTFSVPSEGDYAVTVWHDLDDDGRFSMTEDYQIEDGWGSSGTIPRGTSPGFKDAKVSVPGYGTAIEIEMIYPED